MSSPVRSAYLDAPSAGSAQLRAALGRAAARRTPRPVPAPLPAAPAQPERMAADPVAAVRQQVWLLPKMPFVAAWRLLVSLVGIAAVLAVALLLDAGIATVQLSFQGH